MFKDIRYFVALTALALAAPLAAEGPKPFPDFTFKKVSPPEPGQGKRITVQIAPTPTEEAPLPETAGTTDAAQTSRYGWFWEKVSAAAADSGPGRLEPALTAIATAPEGQGVNAPRLDTLLAIAQAQAPHMLLASVNSRVSPALVLAVISVESGGREEAVSGAGAEGLMQLIPATAARFGVEDALDAGQNIRGGVAYLDLLLREFQDDPVLALAAYNAGENAVKEHSGVPPYAETRDYVPKVLAAFAVARNLCKTPPELISDGCVFNLSP